MDRAASLEREMKSVLLMIDYEKVTRLCYATAEKTYVRTKHTQVLKLENLVTRKKSVVNYILKEWRDGWST